MLGAITDSVKIYFHNPSTFIEYSGNISDMYGNIKDCFCENVTVSERVLYQIL